jgi:hypothetical protein
MVPAIFPIIWDCRTVRYQATPAAISRKIAIGCKEGSRVEKMEALFTCSILLYVIKYHLSCDYYSNNMGKVLRGAENDMPHCDISCQVS